VGEIRAKRPSAAVKKVINSEELVESLQDLMVIRQLSLPSTPLIAAVIRHCVVATGVQNGIFPF
jgi:hypothetical protein